MKHWVMVFALIAATASCKRAGGDVEIDDVRLARESDKVISEVLARPVIATLFDGLFTKVGADPGVSAALDKVRDDLAGDAAVSAALEKLFVEMQAEPAFMKAVTKVMLAHQGASPDEVGKLFGEQVERRIASPEVDQAFNKAFGELIDIPELAGVGKILSEAFSADFMDAPRLATLDARLRARVLAANDGVAPDCQAATTMVLEKALNAERFVAFFKRLIEAPVLVKSSVELAQRALELSSVRARLKQRVAVVLGDPEVRRRCVALMGLVVADDSSAADIETALRAVVMQPTVRAQFVGLVEDVMADADMRKLAAAALARIVDDPDVRAAFAWLVVEW